MTVGQFFLCGLGGCLSFETVVGHEVVVSISAAGHKAPEAEVALESSEGSGSSLIIRPLSLKAVVVNEDLWG